MSFFTLRRRPDYSVTREAGLFAAAAILLTQAADAATTVIGMSRGAVEQNPVMDALIGSHGHVTFAIFKMALGLFLAFSTWRRRYAPWVISALYAGVAAWNLNVISNLP